MMTIFRSPPTHAQPSSRSPFFVALPLQHVTQGARQRHHPRSGELKRKIFAVRISRDCAEEPPDCSLRQGSPFIHQPRLHPTGPHSPTPTTLPCASLQRRRPKLTTYPEKSVPRACLVSPPTQQYVVATETASSASINDDAHAIFQRAPSHLPRPPATGKRLSPLTSLCVVFLWCCSRHAPAPPQLLVLDG